VDDEKVLGAVPGSPEYFDLMTRPRVERIVDANQLDELFAGSM
jgi:hypothetical protein